MICGKACAWYMHQEFLAKILDLLESCGMQAWCTRFLPPACMCKGKCSGFFSILGDMCTLNA